MQRPHPPSRKRRSQQPFFWRLILVGMTGPMSAAMAQSGVVACVTPQAVAVAWGACSGTQDAIALKPGQTTTVQNTVPGYVGVLTRICGLNGVMTPIAAPCAARSSILPVPLPGGDWTSQHLGQNKPVTLTVKSSGGCTSSQNYVGSALVNRDGSITVTVPPYSGFANCTAPRPYLQNPTTCTLISPGDGRSAFTFGPGFVVSSVPAENDRGGGCN